MRDNVGKLNLFDVTNIIVGTVLGTGIFITVAITSGLVGPASLMAWLTAGTMALIIALSFNYCVMIIPESGGPFAFAVGGVILLIGAVIMPLTSEYDIVVLGVFLIGLG